MQRLQKRQRQQMEKFSWISGIPGEKQQSMYFKDIVDAFNESQDKYEVKTTTQADYTETYEKLQAGIAGKKAPDMALLDTDKSRNLSEKNLVADINEYVEKDDSFEKDDYLPVFYEQGEYENGKLFALPAYGTTQVMYYNKRHLKKRELTRQRSRPGRILQRQQRK